MAANGVIPNCGGLDGGRQVAIPDAHCAHQAAVQIDQWESLAGLGAYGLAIRPSGEVVTPRPPLPIVPARWKLQEIVPATP